MKRLLPLLAGALVAGGAHGQSFGSSLKWYRSEKGYVPLRFTCANADPVTQLINDPLAFNNQIFGPWLKPKSLVPLPGDRLFSLGLTPRSDYNWERPRAEVLISNNGGQTWRCASPMTPITLRAGSTVFSQLGGGSLAVVCIAGGREAVMNETSGELAGFGPATSDVRCTADGVSWRSAAPLPFATTGMTAVSIPADDGSGSSYTVLFGGFRSPASSDDLLVAVYPPPSVDDRYAALIPSGWARIPLVTPDGAESSLGLRAGMLGAWSSNLGTLVLAGGMIRFTSAMDDKGRRKRGLNGLNEKEGGGGGSAPLSSYIMRSEPANALDIETGLGRDAIALTDMYYVSNLTTLLAGAVAAAGAGDSGGNSSAVAAAPWAEIVAMEYPLPQPRVFNLFRPYVYNLLALADDSRPGQELLMLLEDEESHFSRMNYPGQLKEARMGKIYHMSYFADRREPESSTSSYAPLFAVRPPLAEGGFNYFLGADPTTGQILKATMRLCEKPECSTPRDQSYLSFCAFEPTDGQCNLCRTCEVGVTYASTPCTELTNRVCTECAPCPAGMRLAIPCGHPSNPRPDGHVCIPEGRQPLMSASGLVATGIAAGAQLLIGGVWLASLWLAYRRTAVQLAEAQAEAMTSGKSGSSSAAALAARAHSAGVSCRLRALAVARGLATTLSATAVLAIAVSVLSRGEGTQADEVQLAGGVLAFTLLGLIITASVLIAGARAHPPVRVWATAWSGSLLWRAMALLGTLRPLLLGFVFRQRGDALLAAAQSGKALQVYRASLPHSRRLLLLLTGLHALCVDLPMLVVTIALLTIARQLDPNQAFAAASDSASRACIMGSQAVAVVAALLQLCNLLDALVESCGSGSRDGGIGGGNATGGGGRLFGKQAELGDFPFADEAAIGGIADGGASSDGMGSGGDGLNGSNRSDASGLVEGGMLGLAAMRDYRAIASNMGAPSASGGNNNSREWGGGMPASKPAAAGVAIVSNPLTAVVAEGGSGGNTPNAVNMPLPAALFGSVGGALYPHQPTHQHVLHHQHSVASMGGFSAAPAMPGQQQQQALPSTPVLMAQSSGRGSGDDIDRQLKMMRAKAATPEARRLASCVGFFRHCPQLLPSALEAVQQRPLPQSWLSVLNQLESLHAVMGVSRSSGGNGDGAQMASMVAAPAAAHATASSASSTQFATEHDAEASAAAATTADTLVAAPSSVVTEIAPALTTDRIGVGLETSRTSSNDVDSHNDGAGGGDEYDDDGERHRHSRSVSSAGEEGHHHGWDAVAGDDLPR